jgi:hypothetical protein
MFGIGLTELLVVGILIALNLFPLALLIFIFRKLAEDRRLRGHSTSPTASTNRAG